MGHHIIAGTKISSITIPSTVTTSHNNNDNGALAGCTTLKEVIFADGRMLVPVRAVSEVFGIDVSWDGKTNTVFISKKFGDGSKDIIDVKDEILPEIQGYWYFGLFEGEVGDFFSE